MNIHTPIMVLLILQIEQEAGEKGKKRESTLPSKPPTPPSDAAVWFGPVQRTHCVISRKILIKYYEYSFDFLIINMDQL